MASLQVKTLQSSNPFILLFNISEQTHHWSIQFLKKQQIPHIPSCLGRYPLWVVTPYWLILLDNSFGRYQYYEVTHVMITLIWITSYYLEKHPLCEVSPHIFNNLVSGIHQLHVVSPFHSITFSEIYLLYMVSPDIILVF